MKKLFNKKDGVKVVGIIGAMPSELADIRKKFPDADKFVVSGFEFYVDEAKNGIKIVHVCCGIAKVNSAVCTQVLIDNFDVDCIINTGIAGGMNSDVKVCDIVISNEVLPHDLDLHFLNDYPPYKAIYEADQKLIDTAVKVCDELGIKHFIGRVVSGESFISDNNVKKDIIERLNPYAVDMESSAIGHCAYLNKVPFVSVRCISVNADDEGAMSFDEFEKIAAKRVAETVLKMVEYL